MVYSRQSIQGVRQGYQCRCCTIPPSEQVNQKVGLAEQKDAFEKLDTSVFEPRPPHHLPQWRPLHQLLHWPRPLPHGQVHQGLSLPHHPRWSDLTINYIYNISWSNRRSKTSGSLPRPPPVLAAYADDPGNYHKVYPGTKDQGCPGNQEPNIRLPNFW